PRVFERVPRGAIFNGEIILSIFEEDNEGLLIEGLLKSMRLLEDNYLGGSGSRGSGQVEFKEVKFAEKNVSEYSKADNTLEFELLKL
ncbi:MAG: type III-A CRISPR-associated RAMP protein Csm3, partial [bacterium]